MSAYVDQSLYPDYPAPPSVLDSPEDRAEYVHRVCTAWDFHVVPEPETIELLSGWKDIFDRYPLATSPAYHAFRVWFGWEAVPFPAFAAAPTPLYIHLDRLEDRPDDPCAAMI